MTTSHSGPVLIPDDNQLIAERREKLAALRAHAKANGAAVFPNDFKPKHQALALLRKYGEVANEETRQLHFLSLKGVPLHKTFTWDSQRLPWEPKRLGENVGIPVQYVIRNDKTSGMGQSVLWGGKARVFQDDGHGTTIFLGEDRVGLTPAGEDMKIYIGDSRDVSVTQG